jgi:hypothetical protein
MLPESKTLQDLFGSTKKREKVTLCECLSDATPERFIWAIKNVPSTEFFGLRDFFHSMGWIDDTGKPTDQKARGLAAAKKAAACKNRAAWTYYRGGGMLYRGKALMPDELAAAASTFRFVGKETLPWGDSARFDLTYRSKYPIQSWTKDMGVGIRFTARAGIKFGSHIPILLRTSEIPSKETLFSPELTNSLFGLDESEIVRTSNTPLKVSAIIPIYKLAVFERETGISMMG